VADVFAIFTTHLCLFYIFFRAVSLDRNLPWFEERQTPRHKEPAAAKLQTRF